MTDLEAFYIRTNDALFSVVESGPMKTSNSPGSQTYSISIFQKDKASRSISKLTVRLSPGSSLIYSNPLSSRIGRDEDATTSRIYICTTSLPAFLPVFVTTTLATTLPSDAI